MPKIKAYKGDGKIIPVDIAKVSTAFQCPWTNKVYGDKRSYIKHLKELRESRMHARARALRRQRIFEEFTMQPDLDHIVKWIELHPEFFFDGCIQAGRDRWGDRRAKFRDDFSIKILYFDLQWSDRISNTHSCPRSGVTNWGSNDDKPRGYPGWQGDIAYQLSHDIGSFSDIFKSTGIHTGSGGGRGDLKCAYDVKLFADDWPGMKMLRAMTDTISYNHMTYGQPIR